MAAENCHKKQHGEAASEGALRRLRSSALRSQRPFNALGLALALRAERIQCVAAPIKLHTDPIVDCPRFSGILAFGEHAMLTKLQIVLVQIRTRRRSVVERFPILSARARKFHRTNLVVTRHLRAEFLAELRAAWATVRPGANARVRSRAVAVASGGEAAVCILRVADERGGGGRVAGLRADLAADLSDVCHI